MYKVASLLFALPMLAEKRCHLLDEYVFQVSGKHSAALVLGAYLLYLFVIGLEEHVEPLERNINIRVSTLLPMLLLRRLSTRKSVTVHLASYCFIVVAEVDCRLLLRGAHLVLQSRESGQELTVDRGRLVVSH